MLHFVPITNINTAILNIITHSQNIALISVKHAQADFHTGFDAVIKRPDIFPFIP